MNLVSFNTLFQFDIAPIYLRHKAEFDPEGIHGVRHIARCLIYSYVLCQMDNTKLSDFDKICFPVAFHDAGRQGSGQDLWERKSEEMCMQYLIKRFGALTATIIAGYINHNSVIGINHKIVHDVDCLDIMRDGSGVGMYNFKKEFLLLKESESIIPDALELINETERGRNFEKYNNSECLKNMIKEIVTNQDKYYGFKQFITKKLCAFLF